MDKTNIEMLIIEDLEYEIMNDNLVFYRLDNDYMFRVELDIGNEKNNKSEHKIELIIYNEKDEVVNGYFDVTKEDIKDKIKEYEVL